MSKEGQDILDLLEEKITEWELDRSEAKILQDINMKELRRRVEKIKETNCNPCSN